MWMLCWVFLNRVQVDNTGMLEFEEFKVFWDKLKKWIVSHRNIHLRVSLSTISIFQNISICLSLKPPQRKCKAVWCAPVDAVPVVRYGSFWTHVLLRAAQCSECCRWTRCIITVHFNHKCFIWPCLCSLRSGMNLNNKILQLLGLRFADDNFDIDFDDYLTCIVRLENMFSTFWRCIH